MILRICKDFSEKKNYLDKPVFSDASILLTKLNYFPQLFALGPQIALKRRWHYFLFWSIITTKLDLYVYKYKDDYICKGLLQAIYLVIINI